MSVRKREWFTGKQRRVIDPEALKIATAAGKPNEAGAWEYLEKAGARLGIEPRSCWIVDYSTDGDQHIKSFKAKRDADKYASAVSVEIDQGKHIAPSKSITVDKAADVWIKRVEADSRERSTLRQYRQHIDLHISPRLGRFKVAQLNASKVESFRDELLENLSRPLARKVLTSLKSMLKANGVGHIAADVRISADTRKHRLEVGRDLPSVDEVRRLVETAKKIDDKGKRETLLLCATLTGLRASELRGLRWSDIDLKIDGELHVRQRADRFGEIGMPKSKAGVRSIPIPPELLSALKRWKLACPKGDADLVFPSRSGRINHHKNLVRYLTPIMQGAHVVGKDGEPKYGLHSFRHFYASWLINPKSRGGRELPAKVAQTLLGHSSITMTLDRYGHLFPRGDDRAELASASAALLKA
jgi:integrase